MGRPRYFILLVMDRVIYVTIDEHQIFSFVSRIISLSFSVVVFFHHNCRALPHN